MKSIRFRLILAIGFLVAVFTSFLLYRTHINETEHLNKLFHQQLDMALNFDLSIRAYASEIIRPILLETLPEGEFIPKAMSSSYISREIFKMVQNRFSDVSIKFSAENPRNPINQAGPDEIEVIKYFNQNPRSDSVRRVIDIGGTQYIVHAQAMRMQESCLRCHGDPADAPRKLIEIYGDEKSFHLPMGAVVGMDAVAIPVGAYHKVLTQANKHNFLIVFSGIVALFFSIFLVIRFMASDRKIMAQTLSRSQVEKEAIVESITDPMAYFQGPDLVVRWANKAALNIAGISNDQYSGLKCHKIYWGIDEPCEYCPALKTFETGAKHEVQIFTADGIYRHLKSFPVKDAGGALLGVIEVASDITSIKQFEERIVKSEEKYRTILDTIEDGYYEVDLTGNLVFFNDALCRILGYSRGELTGMNNRYFMSDETSQNIYQTFNRVFLTGESSKGVDVIVIHKNGTKRYISISISLMRDKDEKPAGFRGIARDVTEHRQMEQNLAASEEKFRILAETSVDPIIQINKNGNIIYVSSSITQLAGFAVDEFMGTHFLKQFPENQIPLAVEIFHKVLSGETVRSGGLLAARKDGQLIDIEVTFSPIWREREIIGLQGTVRDTSEKTRYENLIKESEAQYRLIFNTVPVGIFHYDHNGVITQCNPQYEQITGVPHDQMIGYAMLENFKNEKLLFALKESLSGKLGVFEGEHTSDISGKKTITRGHFVPVIDESTNITGGVCMVEDIAETFKAQNSLKENQKNLETLFDAITESVLLVDPEGVILALNKTAANRLSGLPDQMVGKNAFDFLSEDVVKFRKEKLSEVVRTGKSVSFEDIRYRRHVWTNFYPIFDEHGHVKRIAVFTLDIHDRKSAEAALRESEAKYRQIFDSTPAALFYYNNQGVIEDCNPRAPEMMGGARDKIIGLNMFERSDHQEILACMRRSLKGDKARFEGTFTIGPDYQTVHVKAVYVPIYSQGKVIGGLCIGEDVTSEVMAQQALKDSEEKYRLIFDSSPLGIFHYDANGVITQCNPKTLELSGADYDAIIGFNLVKELKNELFLEAIRNSLAGITTELEGKYLSITGGKKSYLRAFTVPIHDADKTVVGGLCMAEDVSEKIMFEKAMLDTEKRYRLLFERAPLAITLTDFQGRFKDFNPSALEMFGYSDLEARNIKMGDVYAEPASRHRLLEELRQHGMANEKEIRFKKKNGDVMDILMNLTVIEMENEEYILSILSDITKQKRIEHELKESHEKMRNLTKYLQSARENERTSIARELHDELGQVLTAINMEAAWVAQKISDDQKILKPRVEAISELAVGAIGSVKRIISELRPTLLSDLGLPAAIKWQTEDYQQRIGIKFEVAIEPEEFVVDEDLGIAIFRIFQEATTNAIRHAHATHVCVSLTENQNEIVLVIKDNGIGITEDKLELNESFGILGMRERTDVFGGSLEISGIPRKGTTLQAKFPTWR